MSCCSTDVLKDAISRGATRNEIRSIAVGGNMQTLQAHGWAKVQGGLTTVEEVLRVLGA